MFSQSLHRRSPPGVREGLLERAGSRDIQPIVDSVTGVFARHVEEEVGSGGLGPARSRTIDAPDY